MGSNTGLGRSPGGGHGNPLRYSCLENSLERSLKGHSPRGHKELDMPEHTRRVATPGLLVQSTMDFWIHVFKAGLNKYIYLNMLCRCLFLSKPTLHYIVVQMWIRGTWLGPDYVLAGFKELSVFLKSCITGFSGSLAILLISHLAFPWRRSWAECGASCLSLLR